MTVAGRIYHYGSQNIDENDIAAVASALRANLISQGASLPEFERAVADRFGARHCLAVSNGTTGLHLAALGLGLAPGGLGWTSPMSFVASANAMRYCGADVDFVDIDPDTFNMSIDVLAERLDRAAAAGRLPGVVMPVHFAGLSCDMKEVAALARRHGVKVIEDACQAMGSVYDGGPVGDGRYSDTVCFSLHPVKTITSGEGGLVLTNDDALYERMARMRSHGVVRGEAAQHDIGPWHAEMQSEGFNYRITDFQCALGQSQLRRMNEFVAKRRRLARRYRERLSGLNHVRLQAVARPDDHAWHLMLVLFDFAALGRDKREVYDALRALGIVLSMHYYPIHLHPFYARTCGFAAGAFPNAERYWRAAFTFPLHVGLEEADIDYICDCIESIVG